jgi:amino acid adenylation domain-containing protein
MTGENRMERILTPLQQAYLLGRSEHVPLGGVAMQDFREFRGRMDADTLSKRMLELVKRHESLRTRIDSAKLIQWVSPEPVVNFDEIDLRTLTSSEALQKIEALRTDFAHQLFDLSRSPWQVTMFHLPQGTDGDTAVVFVRFDALIADGRSISALLVELFGGAEITPVAEAETTEVAPPDNAKRTLDAAYWASKLENVDGPPQLPWTKPLETIKSSRYARESLTIERERFARIARIGARQRLFKNSAVSAVVLEVVSCWLNEGALCVGVPVAPQTSGALANRSSFIAVTWDANKGSFTERAEALQSDVMEGLDHLAYSGIDLSRLLINNNPDVLALPVVITNALSWPMLNNACPIRQTAGLTQTPQVAMDIRFSQDGSGNLVFDVDFAREALDETLVRAILAALDKAITAICATEALTLEMREVVDVAHYHFNDRHTPFVCSGYLRRIADHLFDASSTRIALISGTRQISYRQLGADVGKIIAAFRKRGVAQDQVVAICLPRSPEHTATVLACALSGIVWVPIDAASPPDRLAYLLENCKPALVISSSPIAGHDVVTPEILLSGEAPSDPRSLTLPLEALSSSENAAYYLYTSGTTGKPKCVVLSNRATSNVIGRTLEAWQVTERDVFISVTPLHHDMSVFDVLGCLTAGATLVMPQPGEEKDAIRWNQLVAEHGVTLWCSVPAILEMLLSCQRTGRELKSLRLVAQGGDYIKPVVVEQLRRLGEHVRLISLGGPTETTIWSIWHEIGPDDTGLVPYGRPLPGNSYFLLNARGDHCPTGVVGRIYTAGVNVALGYLDHGALNQTDFVTVVDENGEKVRAYQTGDRGRYRADGTLLFASRVNGYVKVRGVRVSLPDIENELSRHPAIQQVLVVDYGVEQRGDAAIGALYVPKPGMVITANDLRSFARQHLPESHVPSRFIVVDALPLSANGKPDRRRAKALIPLVNAVDTPAPQAHAPSTSANTHDVLGVYLSVLGKAAGAHINDTTDFLTLGLLPSHLKAVSARLREAFGVEISLAQLLRCRNAAQVKQLFERTPRSA